MRALVHRVAVSAGDWVAVHGCGGLGLSAVQIAAGLGTNVVAVDIREEPLDIAVDIGADETVHARRENDVPGRIHSLTDGGAHVSLDALGRAETFRNSIACLRSCGKHVQVGLTTDAEAGEVSRPIDSMTEYGTTDVEIVNEF